MSLRRNAMLAIRPAVLSPIISAAAVFFVAATGFAGSSALTLGHLEHGTFDDRFVVALERGDFVQVKVNPRGHEVAVTSFDPTGQEVRGGVLGPEEGTFAFVAGDAGLYIVRLSPRGQPAEAGSGYDITLMDLVPLAKRLTVVQSAPESPRIRTLRRQVGTEGEAAVDAFWREVQDHGAPLIEPLPAGDHTMLVTFLWKGDAATRDVLVLWFPFASQRPSECFMERVGETNVWFKTVVVSDRERFDYKLAPNVPHPGLNERFTDESWPMIMAAARPDPLNPKRWRIDQRSVDAEEYRGNSIVEMPNAPPQPWIVARSGVPKGKVIKEIFKSDVLKNEREIAVYLPAGYSDGQKQPYPLVLLFDERAYVGDPHQIVIVPTPAILDNLIAEKRIEPTVAILVGNVVGQREHELACNPVFEQFLLTELLPWAHAKYNFANDPGSVTIGGSSLGGLAATCAAFRHPDRFGNVLAQSGAFWWRPASEAATEPNWVARQFIASPKLPLRFYLDAGSDEVDLSGGGDSILVTTRDLRDVLLARGYEVHFQEFAGGHDFLSWRGTLADGLMALRSSAR